MPEATKCVDYSSKCEYVYIFTCVFP